MNQAMEPMMDNSMPMGGEYQQIYNGPIQTNESLLKYQIDPEEIIQDVENLLRGVVLVADLKTGEKREVKKYPELVNEKGRSSVLLILKSTLTKIFILSDLDESNISRMTISLGNNVIDLLSIHWNEYGLKSYPMASIITGTICNTVYASLRKAHMGNYLKFLKTSEKISEVYHSGAAPQQQESNPGPLSFLKALGGNRR